MFPVSNALTFLRPDKFLDVSIFAAKPSEIIEPIVPVYAIMLHF